MRSVVFTFACLIALGVLNLTGSAYAAGIEADPAKTYTLTKNRGPWMVMVATFHTTGADGQTDEGKSPEQAAHDLVLELRQLGMPAYVFTHEQKQERITVTDDLGREESRKNLRRINSVCVLAGNYGSIDDKLAQSSLEWIKKTKPKCLTEGVLFEPTKARPSVLSGAFLCPNPLLSAAELEQRKTADPLLVRLNHGEHYSLLENKGQYTLVIARFSGKHMVIKDQKSEEEALKKLEKVSLDDAAESARELVTVLRGNYDKDATQFNNVDAYIWHDHNDSVVTVGTFSSPNDPAIEQYLKRFGPGMKTDVRGNQSYQPQHLGMSGFGAKRDQARLWVFEPDPVLMKVPRLK